MNWRERIYLPASCVYERALHIPKTPESQRLIFPRAIKILATSRNSPDFTEVTQKISAFTSNVTDLSFVYRRRAKENLAIRRYGGIFRRNTSRMVSGCRRRRRKAEGDAVKRSANNAWERERERPLCVGRRYEASRHRIASPRTPLTSRSSRQSLSLPSAKGWLQALTRLPSLQPWAKARKGIKEKAWTLAPEPPFDLRENRGETPNDNVYQQLHA